MDATAIFRVIVNHFRTQQLSDVRLDIFESVEKTLYVPLWHTLKYLMLLPSLYAEPLCEPKYESGEWSMELRCWLYEVEVRVEQLQQCERPRLSLKLYGLVVDAYERRVTITDLCDLSGGAATFRIDMIHGRITTPRGPVSIVDQRTTRPLSAFRRETGVWVMALSINHIQHGDAVHVNVRGLHD